MKQHVKKRFLWADLVRIIAIYFVLVIHSSSLPSHIPKNTLDIRFLSEALIKTCVPLFVMLSGALLLGKKETYSVFFKKRFSRIIIPWIFWAAISTMLALYLLHTAIPSQALKDFSGSLESFWFIPMIIGLYLLTPATRIFIRNAKKQDILLVLMLWFVGISFLPYTRDSLAFPQHVDNGLVRQIVSYWGYFVLGYYILLHKTQKIWLLFGCFLTVGGIIWTMLGEYFLSLQHNGLTLSGFYEYGSPSIVFTSVGCFLIILTLAKYVEPKLHDNVKNFIVLVSSFSLGIFFIHQIVQQILAHFLGTSYLIVFFVYIDNFINAGILFVVCFVLIAIIDKVPFGKKLLGR